jgi:ABC-type dipeptide/oligopeptide/nickel transport system permease component
VIRYVLTRVLQGIVVILGAALIGFILTNVIGKPGDVFGPLSTTPEQRDAFNKSLGYNEPLVPRFVDYIVGILHGNFGLSFRTNESAMNTVLAGVPETLLLVVSALTVATLVALLLAIYSVRHREGRLDRLLRQTIGILQGLPDYWLALMLILVFSVWLSAVPSFGLTGPSSLVLPTVALAVPLIPILFRVFRGELLDVLSNDFLEAMRARGLSERTIVYRHGIRNMVGPCVTFVALLLGGMFAGDIIVETIFAWPGIGNLAFSAVQTRDYAVVQAIIIVVATFYVVLNLAADLFVLFTDPRVRSEKL